MLLSEKSLLNYVKKKQILRNFADRKIPPSLFESWVRVTRICLGRNVFVNVTGKIRKKVYLKQKRAKKTKRGKAENTFGPRIMSQKYSFAKYSPEKMKYPSVFPHNFTHKYAFFSLLKTKHK